MPDTDEIPDEAPYPWIPETNVVSIAALNKLQEELSEAGKVIARILIQGVDERDPETGKVNREALQDELADVFALARINMLRFDLNSKYISKRNEKKFQYISRWLDKLKIMYKEGDTHERKFESE